MDTIKSKKQTKISVEKIKIAEIIKKLKVVAKKQGYGDQGYRTD